jgi:Uma2 family endonuclease
MATRQNVTPAPEPKFTSADLLLLPDDNKRYEIIEGELYVSRSPSYEHQYTCGCVWRALDDWNRQRGAGVAVINPGLVFGDNDDVIPDVVWLSRDRFLNAVDEAGHFRVGPELAVEVLSLGKANEDRDWQTKLKLYSRRGVQEYWIVDWMARQVDVHRRIRRRLQHVETLLPQDEITSPLLPGFVCRVSALFFTPPKRPS